MSLPKLTGLTPADIADFDQLLDLIPHGYAKHLAQWMNEKIYNQVERDKQQAAELEALARQLEQESRPMTKAERISAYVDELADSSEPLSPLNNIH